MKRVALTILCVGLGLSGCAGTVTPDRISSSAASYDGNDQNSGIVSVNALGYLVTAHFRERYNALIETYGRDFTVPLKKDAGITEIDSSRALIDRQHLSKFLEMNAWNRAGLKPKNAP
jgi:hypothetical protein